MAAVCLSDLPDDLLCHILSFAPLKEAASTSALARRWRTLWLLSGAINLDSRTRHSNIMCQRTFSRCEALYSNVMCPCRTFRRDARAAMVAYRSSGFHVKKLTFYYDDWGGGDMRRPLDQLLSRPAARHLEELYFGRGSYGGMCSYAITTLPAFKALRVLHITNCMDSHTAEDMVVRVAFPRLTELRLYVCNISHEVLQAMIDASPLLTTLQLDRVCLDLCHDSQHSLSLPKVSTLLLQDFVYGYRHNQTNLQLDAPNLRCFMYKGFVRPLSLKSPVPFNTRVQLHFNLSSVHGNSQGKFPFSRFNVNRRDVACQLFWEFVASFSGAKMLMLSFEPPDQIHTAIDA
uniref:Uncharacterized protein n=1 Tax=Avena sativa TaxID=4498 RepID=A0ACD5WME5_AVESA